ncbi:MAG TPA: hypothetical protein PLZ77_10125, partial [Lachnospiraceae bacterium]|nr:hypothetical protein [Lachnospiraceae bacterium]
MYVTVDKNNNKITIDLDNPNGYTVTGVNVEDLVLDESKMIVSPDRIIIYYKSENDQTRWKDSYLLTSLSYQKVENGMTTVGTSDYSEQPVRIPLTLYRDIYNVDNWSEYINSENNYGNYDNYRIMADLNFAGYTYTTNCKIGRLIGGKTRGAAILSNINLKGSNVNLIFRLNSEMRNLSFSDCSVESSGRDCVGLIGTSAASIENVAFNNVQILDANKSRSYMGLIGYQIGGELSDITMNQVTVGFEGNNQSYVGGLTGYATGGTLFKNIETTNIAVSGKQYIGGIVGYTGRASFDTICVTDARVTASVGYLGGVVGYYDCPRTTKNGPCMVNIHVSGTPILDSNGVMTGSSTVIGLTSNPTTGNYVGGICGLQRGYRNGWETSQNTETGEK